MSKHSSTLFYRTLFASSALMALVAGSARADVLPLDNSGFESGTAGWRFSSGSGVAINNPHSGLKLAFLDAKAGATIQREFKVREKRDLQLAAWVATVGSNGKLEVSLNNRLVWSLNLPKEEKYQRYALGDIEVKRNDVLKISVKAATDGWINIDDFEIADDTHPITVSSSNAKTVDMFNWAVAKANNWVLPEGKVGVINQDERAGHENGDGTATYKLSYWAGYQVRSGFYSRDMVHQLPGAHLIGLAQANKNMLLGFAKSATPARKYFPIWAINFDTVTPLSIDFRNDNDYVREVPAAFELVQAANKAYRWSGDRDYITNSTFWNFYKNTLSVFIDLHDTILRNGVAEGTGTGDIFKGAASYNEQHDDPLFEAGDSIGSQYQAYLAAANFAKNRGEEYLADTYQNKAVAFRRYYNQVWSVSPNFPELARGWVFENNVHRQIGGWGKENSWFMPMKEIVDAGPRLTSYLDFIEARVDDPVTSPNNIEARTYLPDTFFPHHRDAVAWKWMQHVYDVRNDRHVAVAQGTNGNYPECSFTLVSQTVEGLLGAVPDAPGATFASRSHLPADVQWLEVKNIPLGENLITIRHDGATKSVLTNQKEGDDNGHGSKGKRGGKRDLVWQAQFVGNHRDLKVDGHRQPARRITVNGITVSVVDVRVKPGKKVTVSTQ